MASQSALNPFPPKRAGVFSRFLHFLLNPPEWDREIQVQPSPGAVTLPESVPRLFPMSHRDLDRGGYESLVSKFGKSLIAGLYDRAGREYNDPRRCESPPEVLVHWADPSKPVYRKDGDLVFEGDKDAEALELQEESQWRRIPGIALDSFATKFRKGVRNPLMYVAMTHAVQSGALDGRSSNQWVEHYMKHCPTLGGLAPKSWVSWKEEDFPKEEQYACLMLRLEQMLEPFLRDLREEGKDPVDPPDLQELFPGDLGEALNGWLDRSLEASMGQDSPDLSV